MWAREPIVGGRYVVVGREGIEPPQSKTADLQSAELTTCSTYPVRLIAFAVGSLAGPPSTLRPGDGRTRSYSVVFLLEPPMGLEPATGGLQNRCSTN